MALLDDDDEDSEFSTYVRRNASELRMDDCPNIESLINLNCGLLGDEAAEEVSEHLDRCATCLSTISSLESSTDPALKLAAAGCRPGFEFSHESGQSVSRASVPLLSSLQLPVAKWMAPHEFRDYVLLQQIGKGGMGTVYRARHVQLDRIVAVKFLSEDRMKDSYAIARFQREMRAVGRLEHPNIVRATDAGVLDDDVHFIAMEFVYGPDISELLRNAKTLSVANACEIAAQTATALDHASRRGLVHRDIKPSNIMISIPEEDYSSDQPPASKPIVRVLDFGLARVDEDVAHTNSETADSCEDSTGLTATGQVMGTPDYIAPEQIGNSHAVDIRADIYSLGATLFRMLTGELVNQDNSIKRPADGSSAPERDIEARLTNRFDTQLTQLVLKMVAHSPADRFQKPNDVIDALGPFRRGANLSQLIQRNWMPSSDASRTSDSPTLSKVDRCLNLTAADDATTDGPDNAVTPQKTGILGEVSAPIVRDRPSASGVRFRWLALAASGLTAVAASLSIRAQLTTVRLEILNDDIAVNVIGTDIRLSGRQAKELSVAQGQHSLLVSYGDIGFQTAPFDTPWFGSEVIQVRLADGFLEARDSNQLLGRAELSAAVGNANSGIESEPLVGSELVNLIRSRDPDAPLPAIAPFSETQAKECQKVWADHVGIEVRSVVELSREVSMAFLVVPPGEFMMGSTREQIEEVKTWMPDNKGKQWLTLRSRSLYSETPQHRVLLSKPWLLGETEVTVSQFREYVLHTDNQLNPNAKALLETAPGNSAMEKVTWQEATEFCLWLSKKFDRHFRLPTEAEWEFACRAGTTSMYYFGDDPSQLPLYAVKAGDANRSIVGQALPNAFGLKDMHGNLHEWCHDPYAPLWYQMSPAVDPTGPEWGDQMFDLRTCRGGSGNYTDISTRSAARKEIAPEYAGPLVGFRVAMSVDN